MAGGRLPPGLLSVIMELTLRKIREGGIFMRKVTCASCGRPYDYDSDDFCPKCGSYNPPAGPRRGPPGAGSARPRFGRFQGPAAPGGPAKHPHRWAPGRCPTAAPREGRPGRSPPHGGSAPRSSFWCSCSCRCSSSALCLPFVLGLMLNLSEAFAGRRPEPGAVAQAEPAGGTHAPFGSPFSIHGTQQVTVEDPWEVDLTYVPLARREGFRCLAVDLWVEGGERRDDLTFFSRRAAAGGRHRPSGGGRRLPGPAAQGRGGISGHPLRRPVGGPPVRPDDLLCPRGCLRRGRAGFVRGGAGQQHPLCRPSDSPGAALGRGRNRVKRSKSD